MTISTYEDGAGNFHSDDNAYIALPTFMKLQDIFSKLPENTSVILFSCSTDNRKTAFSKRNYTLAMQIAMLAYPRIVYAYKHDIYMTTTTLNIEYSTKQSSHFGMILNNSWHIVNFVDKYLGKDDERFDVVLPLLPSIPLTSVYQYSKDEVSREIKSIREEIREIDKEIAQNTNVTIQSGPNFFNRPHSKCTYRNDLELFYHTLRRALDDNPKCSPGTKFSGH